MIINNYNLVCTGKDCPETYDVFSFVTGTVVAKVSLRFGILQCNLTSNNRVIYNYNFSYYTINRNGIYNIL